VKDIPKGNDAWDKIKKAFADGQQEKLNELGKDAHRAIVHELHVSVNSEVAKTATAPMSYCSDCHMPMEYG